MTGCVLTLLLTLAQFAQSNAGELRLFVIDEAGLPVQSAVELVSESNQFRETYTRTRTACSSQNDCPLERTVSP